MMVVVEEVGVEGGGRGGEALAGDEVVGTGGAGALVLEPEPEPEPDPKPAPPLNFPAKHCVIKGTSFPPLGVKLNTYVSSKLPADHPTQPKKLSEFSFRKSNAAQTSVIQLWALLPPPISVSRACRFESLSQLSRDWKAELMPLVVQAVAVPE